MNSGEHYEWWCRCQGFILKLIIFEQLVSEKGWQRGAKNDFNGATMQWKRIWEIDKWHGTMEISWVMARTCEQKKLCNARRQWWWEWWEGRWGTTWVLGRMTRNIERDDKVPWKTLSMPRRMMGALGQGKAPLPKQNRNLGQMGRLEWLLGMFQGFETSLLALGTTVPTFAFGKKK